MQRLFFMFVVFFLTVATAGAHQMSDEAVPFQKSESCKECHSLIYEEWYSSMHSKSSLFKDNAHAAMHKAYSNFKKKNKQPVDYACGSCHAPMASKLNEFISGQALPDGGEWQEQEGVGCTFCHRIEAVVHKQNFNIYALNKDGAMAVSNPSEKADHSVVESPLFNSGTVCMGCHSHIMMNGVNICVMRDEGEVGNCLQCHMDQTSGAPALGSDKKVHKSHIMGGGHHLDTLQKAVTLDAFIEYRPAQQKALNVVIQNIITHTFPSTNPMRMAFLKINGIDKNGKIVWSNFTKSPLEDKKSLFMKAFKKGEKMGVPPWLAESVGMDTRLKNGEKRILSYELPKNIDIANIKLVLIYRLFPPKAIDKLGVPADGVNDKNHIVMKKMIQL